MRPAVMEWCRQHLLTPVCEVSVKSHLADVVAVRFAPRPGRTIPRAEMIVGIELKLTDYTGVMQQCNSLASWCHVVYAVIPQSNFLRMRGHVKDRFKAGGIGLLGYESDSVVSQIPPVTRKPLVSDHELSRFERNLWRRIRDGKTFVTDKQKAERESLKEQFEQHESTYHAATCECRYCVERKSKESWIVSSLLQVPA